MENAQESVEKISVYVFSDKERALVEGLMKQVPNNDIEHYSNVVIGWANASIAKEIISNNLMIDSAQTSAGFESSGATSMTAAQKQIADESKAQPKTRSFSLDPIPVSYRITFREPLSHEIREELKAQGIELLESNGINSFLVLLTKEQHDNIASEPYVRSLTEETIKVGKRTAEKWLEQKQKSALEEVDADLMAVGAEAPEPDTYDIDLYREEDMKEVLPLLADNNVSVIEQAGKSLRVTIPDAINTLVTLNTIPFIRCINKYDPPALFCNTARMVVGIVDASRQHIFKWKGKDEIIGVLDSGIDATHADLQGVIANEFEMPGSFKRDKVGHGTHVAGIIAGRGAEVTGIAPESQIVNVSMVDAEGKLILPLDYKKLLGPAVQAGARILNLSWGTPIGASYDEGSYKVDEFAYENPNVLIVVAAGNAGTAPTGEHAFKTIAAPASSKNVLTVGAVTTSCDKPACPTRQFTVKMSVYSRNFPKPPAFNELLCAPPAITAAISSRGPTDYDSVKPEVLAPGMYIESLKSTEHSPLLFVKDCVVHGDTYAVTSGTSMAAPFVSGMAAIFRQYLKEEFQVNEPSSSLLKAMLIACADDLHYISDERKKLMGYPDFDQGFGLVNLKNILPHAEAPAKRKILFDDIFSKSNRALQSRMPPNAQIKSARVYSVTVPQGATGPLRIVLCWNDPPGRHVQNNLQLDVITPDSTGIPGNADHTFHKDPLFDRLNVFGKPYDKNNTVEMVRIDNPQPGEYKIRVIAENTPRPNQGYALLFVGETDDDKLIESGL